MLTGEKKIQITRYDSNRFAGGATRDYVIPTFLSYGEVWNFFAYNRDSAIIITMHANRIQPAPTIVRYFMKAYAIGRSGKKNELICFSCFFFLFFFQRTPSVVNAAKSHTARRAGVFPWVFNNAAGGRAYFIRRRTLGMQNARDNNAIIHVICV